LWDCRYINRNYSKHSKSIYYNIQIVYDLSLIQILISGYNCYQSKKPRYFCPNNCGKSYKFSNTLNRHVKYECGDMRKFHCPCCLKAFKQKSAMQAHVAVIHRCFMK